MSRKSTHTPRYLDWSKLTKRREHSFYKDRNRDWEICYEPIRKVYLVRDNQNNQQVAVDEQTVEGSFGSDAKFHDFIRYVDGLLCTNDGISHIKLPALIHRAEESDEYWIPPCDDPRHPETGSRVRVRELHQRVSLPPLNKELEAYEVENIDQWADRISNPPHLVLHGFIYTNGAWITISRSHRALKKIRRYFVENMEATGYQGANIEGNWWHGYKMDIYFTSRKKTEEARRWIGFKFGI